MVRGHLSPLSPPERETGEDVKKLKLFVWYGVRQDYTDGIAFALAENVEDAREQIRKISDDWEWKGYKGELMNEPKVYTKPFGFWMSGGG